MNKDNAKYTEDFFCDNGIIIMVTKNVTEVRRENKTKKTQTFMKNRDFHKAIIRCRETTIIMPRNRFIQKQDDA